MQPWNEAPPPDLPTPSLAARVGGALRLAGIVALTASAVGVFLLGRTLRGWLGKRVTFHFEVARWWAIGCLRLTGLRPSVRGAPIRAGALIANHSSWLDILALRAVRLIYFVSKAEVATWPGIGFVTRVTGTIFIDRRRTEAKRQEALLRSRIAHDQLLCFFPEATSTDGQRVLSFKSSLFSAFYAEGRGTGLPIQPVTLRYRPAPGLPESFYGWWGTMPFEGNIWNVVTLSRGGTVELIFHPPVTAAEFPDRKALAEHCRAAVVAGRETGAPADRRPGQPSGPLSSAEDRPAAGPC